MSIENDTLYTWTLRINGCSDAVLLDGQIMEYEYWQSVMTPGNQAAACRGRCDCELIMAEEGIEETESPYVVEGSAELQGSQPPMQTNQDESELKKLTLVIQTEGKIGGLTIEEEFKIKRMGGLEE